jgi:hypothetical protein
VTAALHRRLVVAGACVSAFVIGLAFVFVRAPHPWGWEGIDQYRELALALARGEPYPSLERAWGYPLFLSAFYWLFGDRQWIPLVVQVAANAVLPYLTYVQARRYLDEQIGVVAAVLVGLLSFNTIYASTQAADALCTVLFVASVVSFDTGCVSGRTRWFALSGVLAGAALMFRPNLLPFPLYLLAVALAIKRREVSYVRLAVYLAAVGLVWAPWPLRNYQLTGRFIPATTHGGVQLWYGSLQAGGYFENWFDNPRAHHQSSPFAYSPPDGFPVRVRATPTVPAHRVEHVTLVYWTTVDPVRRTVVATRQADGPFEFDVPPQRDGSVIMFFVDGTWSLDGAAPMNLSVPRAGAGDPKHHTISSDHFANLDLNESLLDVFDIAAMADHVSWGGALEQRSVLDLNTDGAVTQADIDLAAGVLTTPWADRNAPRPGQLRTLRTAGAITFLTFADGSTLALPRGVRRTVDITVQGDQQSAAANTLRSSRTLRSLTLTSADVSGPALETLSERQLLVIEVNPDFARREPFWMDRYTALAIANISGDPSAFVWASLKRVLRMFVVVGSSDNFRSTQFSARAAVFAIATVLSVLYLLLFLMGVVVLVRRGHRVGWLLAPVLYLPATLFMMLPNMRYTVTAQPFVLIFVAAALVAVKNRAR